MSDDWHHCHFCGEDIKDGKDPKGERHWLSDCRPDLVKHEIGPLCTWPYKEREYERCYAYGENNPKTDGPRIIWTKEHTHFYPDGPM